MPVNDSQTFKRFVEVGRVVLVKEGAAAGKLAAIVEIIDHNKALMEGREVPRQAIAYRNCTLTPIVLSKLTRGARHATLTKVWQEADVEGKWSSSAWAQKIAQSEKRRNTTDFDRFNVMILKKQRRRQLGKDLAKAKKA